MHLSRWSCGVAWRGAWPLRPLTEDEGDMIAPAGEGGGESVWLHAARATEEGEGGRACSWRGMECECVRYEPPPQDNSNGVPYLK